MSGGHFAGELGPRGELTVWREADALAPAARAEADGDAPAAGEPSSPAGRRVLVRGWLAGGGAGSPEQRLADARARWGDRLQPHVDGQYACVVSDPAAGSALLTHDALGIGPLFWRERRGRLEFSTRLADLVDAGAAADLDGEYLADFVAYGLPPGARTPYRSIRRLTPGTSLRWAKGRAAELTTWDPTGVEPLKLAGNAEYEERFRELVGESATAALDREDPITWIALSGGLDSITVAAAAVKSGADLRAYSVVAPNWPESDESHWIRMAVDALGLPWEPIDAEDVLPFARLPDEFCGEPSESVVNLGLVDAVDGLLGASGARVLLTGKGGDSFAGGLPADVPAHLADPLFGGHPLRALRGVRAWQSAADDPRPLKYWLRWALAEPALWHLLRRRSRLPMQRATAPWLTPEYAQELRGRVRRSPAPRARTPGRQAVLDDLWQYAAQMEFAGTLAHETRHPLLYRPLFEFMLAVPWEQKLLPRCDRYLQRRALRGVVPDALRRRISVGTGSRALIEGLSRSPEWRDYLCERPRMAEHGIADAERWRAAVAQASVGQTHGDRHFLSAIAVEVWLRQLEDRPRARPAGRTQAVAA